MPKEMSNKETGPHRMGKKRAFFPSRFNTNSREATKTQGFMREFTNWKGLVGRQRETH